MANSLLPRRLRLYAPVVLLCAVIVAAAAGVGVYLWQATTQLQSELELDAHFLIRQTASLRTELHKAEMQVRLAGEAPTAQEHAAIDLALQIAQGRLTHVLAGARRVPGLDPAALEEAQALLSQATAAAPDAALADRLAQAAAALQRTAIDMDQISSEVINHQIIVVRTLRVAALSFLVVATVALLLLGVGFDHLRRTRARAMVALADAKRLSADLKASNEDLERFGYAASHDLQEPLRTVASYLGLIERREGHRLSPEALEFFAYARDGAERMKNMINDLLEISRVATRALPLEPVDTAAVARAALANLRAQIRDADAVVEVEALPPVLADPTQLMRVFQNLVGNALKYAEADRPPRVTIGGRALGPLVEIDVTDNGRGMNATTQERAFDVFYRGVRSGQGTGVGLSLVKRIVEHHGGSIRVDSTVGAGTTFHIRLPAAPREAVASSAAA